MKTRRSPTPNTSNGLTTRRTIPPKSPLAELRLLSAFRDFSNTVVEEYRFVSDNNQIKLFVYRNGTLLGQQQLLSTETLIADRIRQLIIYSADGSTPIYLADGVGDTESTIKTDFQAVGPFQIDFRLRLPIVFGHYQLRLKLKQTSTGPVFREMRIATFRLKPDQTPDDVKEEEIKYSSATGPKDSFLPSQINSIIERFIPRPIDLVLERYATTSGGVVTETNSFFNEIGLVLVEPDEKTTFQTEFRFAGHSAMLNFPANQTTNKTRVYMPLVRVNLGRQLDRFYTNPLIEFPPVSLNKGVVNLKGLGRAPQDGTFVANPKHTIRFEQKYGDRFTELWLSQYPSPDSLPVLLSFAPQLKVRESLIIIENVPAHVVQEYWNEEVAAEYYRQSEEVSFLPMFKSDDDFAVARYWNLTYVARSTHERLFTKFKFHSQVDESGFLHTPDAAEVKVKWLSFHPQRGYKARVSFEKLLTHDRTGLQGLMNLKGPKTTTPEIPSPEITKTSEQFTAKEFGGLNLIFDGPIELPSNYSATVRIGALDLTFSTFINSVSPAPPPNPGANRAFFAFLTRFYEDNLVRVFANDIPFRVAAVDAGGQDDLPLNFFAGEEQTVSIQSPCAIPPDDRAAREQLKSKLRGSSSAANVREWIEKYERPIEAHYLRETPLVVTVKKNSPLPNKAPYKLNVDESRLEKLQRTIRLKLDYLVDQAGNAPGLIELKAVVLDQDPLLVAQVEFPADVLRNHKKEVELAVWTNASHEGKRWKLNSSAGPFEIVLPPQAVGEEMEKYGNIGKQPGSPPPPPVDEPIDFRLGPPAEIRVSASGSTPLQEFGTELQNYTEPPWNLRRLLGYPGQRDPGLWVRHMQFELLYGLSCEVDYPYLRLAEITSLLGMIPGRLAMPQSNQNKYSDQKEALANFLLARFDWAVVNRRYLSRIGLILPWNTRPVEPLAAETDQKGSAKGGSNDGAEKKASSTTFLIQKGAQCFIRREARQPLPNATASPDPSGLPPADLKSPVDSDSHGGFEGGIEGGAVWGLESKNIFDAIMRLDEDKPNFKFPRSDKATTTLSDLIFSSFGGWGKVSAPFDNRRSKIYANVSMGRTFTYEVERIGRIAVFWNRAKHVIVYERTVVPSKQMAPYQGAHLGRPIIRKVREYVEILEDVRSYPEKLPDGKILQTELGFIEACDFLKKGQQFNVLSFWGGDVGSQGWKVPLWNQAAEPKEVYPKPRIGLQIQVRSENDEPGKKTRTERCFIQNPENVFFYTSTLPGETDDTDAWKPVVGVDLVDVPKGEPLADFDDGNNVQTTPDDPVVHPGYGPVTFLLEPNSPPANLIAGKSDEPMSAVLKSVSMMRGRPLDDPALINDGPLKQIAFLRKDLALNFQELLKQIPVDPARAQAEIAKIKDQLKAKVDAIPLLNDFGNQLQGVKERFDKKSEELNKKLETAEAEIFNAAQERLNRIDNDFHASGVLHQLREEYASIRTIVQDPSGQLTKLQFVDAVERQLRKLQEGLTLVEIAPGGLLRNIEQIIAHFEQVKNELKEWNDFLGSIPGGTVPAARLAKIRQIIVAFTELTDRVISSTQNGTLRSSMDWLPDAFVGTRDKFFPEFEKRYAALKSQQVKTALEKIAAGTLQKADIASLLTKIFDETDATSLMSSFKRTEINAFLNENTELRKSLDGLTNPKLVNGWLSTQEQRVIAFISGQDTIANRLQLLDELSSRVSKEISDANHIFNQYKTISDFVIARQRALLPAVLAGATKNIEEIDDFIKGKTDALGNVIEKGLKAKIDEIGNDIRSGVEGLRSELLEKTDAFVESTVRALPRLGEKPYVILDAAPRLIRAFGEPPKVPNLTFQRPVLAYFYNQGSKVVDLSPVISRVAQANEIINAAKPLGIDLPTINILERLVPKGLESFDLSSILPNIAGLDLKDLFSGIKLPKSATNKVTITHGFDIQARRGWVRALIHDIEISKRATVFSIGPLEFVLNKAVFTAEMRFEAAKDEQPKKSIKGQIFGDWEVIVGGVKILVIERTALSFDESGKLKFDIKIKNVKLPEVLAFVSDLLSFTSADGGLSFRVTKEKVEALLNLPVPPIMAGVSGIANLHLSVAFRLFFSPVFKIATSFSFGGKLKPFNTTAFILSGGGYIEVEANYVPSLHAIGCAVEIGLALGARLGIALGPINGSVYIYFGIYVRYQVSPGDAQNAGLRIGVTYLIGGEVNVLGLVSCGISLLLDASYLHGKLTGRGQLSIHIKICWCFTLEIEEEVEYTVGSGSGGGGNARLPRRNDRRQLNNSVRFLNASYAPPSNAAPAVAETIDPGRILALAGDYVAMLS